MVTPFSKSITKNKAFINQPLGKAEQIILCVTFLFKGATLNKKMSLDYESLRLPETSIFKWNGYTTITPRFSDTDALGHINNTNVPVWFEGTRDPLFRLFTPDLSPQK